MRIDLPLCSFKLCKYCLDGNCIKKSEHERCEYRMLSELRNSIGDDYDLDRLKELVEADRDGRCVVLPCKVGGKVYCIQSYFNDAKMRSDEKVKCMTVDFVQSFPDLFECQGTIYKFYEIGKTVFLTREEAEAALENMKERDKQWMF